MFSELSVMVDVFLIILGLEGFLQSGALRFPGRDFAFTRVPSVNISMSSLFLTQSVFVCVRAFSRSSCWCRSRM